MEKLELVDSILTHDEVYPYLIDDGSPDRARFSFEALLENPCFYVLMPNEGSVFLFTPHNFILYEVHCGVLPAWRGLQVVEAARGARDWMFANTPCQKIITVCPRHNLGAYALARRSGMTEIGIITKAFLKNGKLVDLILLSISKGE